MPVGGELAKKKAMWLYPKILGFNPPQRWGHSACHFNGSVYVFGGCCGGLHFSDVLVLDLDTMGWTTLVTVGYGPGPRDSHSAVLVGHRMIVFGGTNGCKKVNDLHMLDMRLKEWTLPEFTGSPPSPRESHSATLVGDQKLVIFGGSGEGEANYLNDLHILDLKTMRWTSPEVKGNIPVPRDSHSAIAIENKLFVYGGDSGDRYHGNVDVFDMDTLTWSRLPIQGPVPGVRAGHAAISLGTKVYVVGGVGDKHYYNDVWVLDVSARSWTQLEICGQQPQGRFSHTAIVAGSDIAIYGGCGEDEHPLNEVLVLQLGAEHPNGHNNISLCKIFGNHLNQVKRSFSMESEKYSNGLSFPESKQSLHVSSDMLHPKRRRTSYSRAWEMELEQEDHSLSLSQGSSPSQSDQEQIPLHKPKASVSASHGFALFKKRQHNPSLPQSNKCTTNQMNPRNLVRRTSHDVQVLGECMKPQDHEQFLQVVHTSKQQETEQRYPEAALVQNMIGSEVRGKVDGAFDSGYLMTAMVNGKLFRGILFAPGPGIVPRGVAAQDSSPTTQAAGVPQPHVSSISGTPAPLRQSRQLLPASMPELSPSFQQPQVLHCSPTVRGIASLGREPGLRSDLQGVDLTLGSPNHN